MKLKLDFTGEEEGILCNAEDILDTIRAKMEYNKIKTLEQEVNLEDLEQAIDTIHTIIKIGCYHYQFSLFDKK